MSVRSTKLIDQVAHHMEYIVIKCRTPNRYRRDKKVAVVTGANKGIGLAIVKGLCQRFDGDVILTARSTDRLQKAKQALSKEGLYPGMELLDITSSDDVKGLKERLTRDYGGLDVLVNNAGVMHTEHYLGSGKFDREKPFPEIVKKTVTINYSATKNLCQELFPLLRPHGRVCNMSSFASVNCLMLMHPRLVHRLFSPLLTMDELDAFMVDYVLKAEHSVERSGYVMSPLGAYGTSKLAINLMTHLQQRALDDGDGLRRLAGMAPMDVCVNACSPGYVVTDMTGRRGQISSEAGAETPLYLCLLPPNVESPRGKLVRHKTCVDVYMDDHGQVQVLRRRLDNPEKLRGHFL